MRSSSRCSPRWCSTSMPRPCSSTAPPGSATCKGGATAARRRSPSSTPPTARRRVIDKAVQIFGGLGVTRGVPVESLYREIRALRIYEGASEVQKVVIARNHLAEHRRMKALLPPGWPRPKGYANGISATRPHDRHRRRDRLERPRRSSRPTTSPASSARCCSNTLAILAEDGAGPEHIVRMTWYVTDIDAYRASLAEIGAAWRELIGTQLPRHGGGRRHRAGRAAGARSRSKPRRWCPNERRLSSATGCRRPRRSPNSSSTCPSCNIPSGSTPRSS